MSKIKNKQSELNKIGNKMNIRLHNILDIIFTKKDSIVYRDFFGEYGINNILFEDLLKDKEISKIYDENDGELYNDDDFFDVIHQQTIKSFGEYLVKNYNKL